MKKLLAMLLSVLMLVSCCAVAVSADGYFNDGVMNWGDDNQFNDDELDWSEYMGLFEIGSAEAVAGETVEIPVYVTNNPGIISLKLNVHYDASVLELISSETGNFAPNPDDVSYGPIEVNPFTINWYDALAETENDQDGVVAYLTFKVKEDAFSGETDLSITFNPNDVFDVELANVEFLAKDGAITIDGVKPPRLAGDANGDGKVNTRDVALMQQYINGWDVKNFNADNANVNGDSKVNTRDVALMQQYLNGWGVTLQ